MRKGKIIISNETPQDKTCTQKRGKISDAASV